jgi:hypothetical protein
MLLLTKLMTIKIEVSSKKIFINITVNCHIKAIMGIIIGLLLYGKKIKMIMNLKIINSKNTIYN